MKNFTPDAAKLDIPFDCSTKCVLGICDLGRSVSIFACYEFYQIVLGFFLQIYTSCKRKGWQTEVCHILFRPFCFGILLLDVQT